MTLLLKKSVTVFLFLICFAIGYARETIFLVINTVIHDYPVLNNTSYLTPPEFLYNIDPQQLMSAKWILTFIFSIIFMSITLLIINFYFKSKTFNKITLIINFTLFVFALIISLIGISTNHFDEFYPISRFIAGLLQSPLLTFAIFTLLYFINKNTIQTK